jgi:hypothetical protein
VELEEFDAIDFRRARGCLRSDGEGFSDAGRCMSMLDDLDFETTGEVFLV